MRKHCLIAIDPGWSGGIAWLLDDGHDVEIRAIKMPETEQDLFDALADIETQAMLRCNGNLHAITEQVNAFSGQGVKAVWNFSANYHLCRMALVAIGARRLFVPPATWQKAMGLVRKLPKKVKDMTQKEKNDHKREKKNRSKELAQELFPEFKITHATAEALLLLEYLRRTAKTLTH